MDSLTEQARAAERDGQHERALELYERAFAEQVRAGDGSAIANTLRWLSALRRELGDLETAEDLAEASLAVAEAHGDLVAVTSALNSLANVAQHRGRIEEAERLYLRARKGALRAGDRRLEAMVDVNLGVLANIRGHVEDALARYESALRVYREVRDEPMVLRCLNNVGMAYVDQRAWQPAAAAFEEAFVLADQLRDTFMLATIALNRAELYLKCGDSEQARECCDVGFEISTRLGLRSSQAEAHKFYGVLYRQTQKPGLAGFHLGVSAALARETEDRLLEAEAEHEHALLLLDQGRNPEGLKRLTRSHQLFTELHAAADISDIDDRLDDLERTFLRVMENWAESIESKDSYTAGHCRRVADYACLLAERLGIGGRELIWFRMGAFLHDVGKIEVPGEILNKPGSLTDEEFEIMKGHTTAGDAIVARLEFPWNIRPIVRHHHEQWCGGGYPDGLAGEAIPLHARILCVADVYDALTTARSYRPALSREEALRIMERESGRVLDPELFRIFRALIEPAAARPRSIARTRTASTATGGYAANGTAIAASS